MEKQPVTSNERIPDNAAEASDWEIDPVCGMDVDMADEEAEQSERNGKTYYFCSSDCRRQFEAAPADFGA
jgi:YHS domain-containing protein